MTRRISKSRISFLLLPLKGLVRAQFAQCSGNSGSVCDTAGVVIPGAMVSLVELKRNQKSSTKTDGLGRCDFSGDALSVTDQNNLAQDYRGPWQPKLVVNPNRSRSKKTIGQYFNVNAFAEAASGRVNAGPGTARWRGQDNWGKNITLYTRLQAELWADRFTDFNNTQWAGVDATFNDLYSGNQFGQVIDG